MSDKTTRIPQPVDIILSTLRRASRAGESNEMAARWIMEDLHSAGWGFGRWNATDEDAYNQERDAYDAYIDRCMGWN